MQNNFRFVQGTTKFCSFKKENLNEFLKKLKLFLNWHLQEQYFKLRNKKLIKN